MLKTRGYTLIELIAVMVLLGILSTVIVVKMPSFTLQRINIVNDTLMKDIKTVQMMAVSRQQKGGIMFTLAQNSYLVYSGNYDYANIINNPSTGTQFMQDLDVSFQDVVINSTTLTGAVLQFNEKGIPCDTAGELTVTKNIILTHQPTGETRTIIITPHTGNVRNE